MRYFNQVKSSYRENLLFPWYVCVPVDMVLQGHVMVSYRPRKRKTKTPTTRMNPSNQ